MVFFFQAEDGIRDLVRSRGLGDVYKRQHPGPAARRLSARATAAGSSVGGRFGFVVAGGSGAVSYTHLTLPTSDLV